MCVRTAASGIWLTSPSASLSWTVSLSATNTRSCSARRLKWATRNGRKSSLCSMVSMNWMKVITMHMFAIMKGVSHKYQLSFCELYTNWWSMTKIFRKLNHTLWLEDCLFNWFIKLMICLLVFLAGAFSTVEEIPENLVHDHEKNGLPRLSSLTPQEITHRYVDKCGLVHARWHAK